MQGNYFMFCASALQIAGCELHVIFSFAVTLDLKALYLLLVKEDDEDFSLGGKGLEVEFCFICQAIRVR